MIKLNKFQRFFLEAWAYLIEALTASAIHVLLVYLFTATSLVEFVIRSGKDWATLEGVLLAAALVIWGFYFNFMGTDFGGFLRWDKSERVFRWAFSFGVFIHLAAAVLLIVVSNLRTATQGILTPGVSLIAHFAFWFLCMAILNVPTMFMNTRVLVRLKNEFEVEKENYLRSITPKGPSK